MIDWFCEKWKKLFYKKIEENSIKLVTSGTFIIEPKCILSESELENLKKEVHKCFDNERAKNTIMVLNTGIEVRYINPIQYWINDYVKSNIKGEQNGNQVIDP